MYVTPVNSLWQTLICRLRQMGEQLNKLHVARAAIAVLLGLAGDKLHTDCLSSCLLLFLLSPAPGARSHNTLARSPRLSSPAVSLLLALPPSQVPGQVVAGNAHTCVLADKNRNKVMDSCQVLPQKTVSRARAKSRREGIDLLLLPTASLLFPSRPIHLTGQPQLERKVEHSVPCVRLLDRRRDDRHGRRFGCR
jgi:hypothetical protein